MRHDDKDKYEDKIPTVFFVVVGLALVLTCLLRMPWHFHLTGSKPQLISLNEDRHRLQISALNHDLHGEVNFATEDYRQMLKAPDFAQLPPGYKMKYRSVIDRRELATNETYLNELFCYEEVCRWRPERMPLKIYIPPKTSPDGFSELDKKFITDAFDLWISVIPTKLSYKLVDSKKDADIRFSQKHTKQEMGPSTYALAHCVPVSEAHSKWNVRNIARADVDVAPWSSVGSKTDAEAPERRAVLIHEIGHALGLGHSCRSDDIMYFMVVDGSPDTASPRDKATLKAIYESDTLVESAEKVIREQASAGNKYALYQLACELPGAEPDSPQRRRRIFELTRKAADLGLVNAQVYLGSLYSEGEGIPVDIGKAVSYWTQAADQGSGEAFLALARLFKEGTVVKRDLNRADYCYRQALNLEAYADAEYADFLCYQRGDQKSYADAITHYKSAAVGLDTEAIGRLSHLYKQGLGVQKNQVLSSYWFNKALYIAKSIKPPFSADTLLKRASLWELIDRPRAALADADAAEKMDKNIKGVHRYRSIVCFSLGDMERAHSDLSLALKASPSNYHCYFLRQLFHLAEEKWTDSIADATMMRKVETKWEELEYPLIYGAIGCRLAHDPREQQFLIELEKRSNLLCWPGPLVMYLNHRIDSAALLALAPGDDQGTEARCILALDQMVNKNTKAAKEHLQWIIDKGDRRFLEYPLAINLLKRLESNAVISTAVKDPSH